MPIVEVEGQQFEFPDGTSDEVIGNAIRQHFATQVQPEIVTEQPQPEQGIVGQGVDILAEIAAGANKSITDLIDFLGPDQVNNILQLAGSEARVPTFGQAAKSIGATQGGFVEGRAGELLRAAGEAIPAAAGGGVAIRQAAARLPELVAPSVEGMLPAVTRQLARGTTATGDIVAGAGAGLGAKAAEDFGPVGQVVGGVAGALTATGVKAAITGSAKAIKSLFSTAIKETGSESGAAKLLAEQMNREGISPEEVARRLEQLGPDAIPADAATTFARILRTASNEIPRIEGRAAGVFRERQIGQAARLAKAFDEAGGTIGVTADDAIKAMDDKLKPRINELYNTARRKGVKLGNVSKSILEKPGLGKDALDKAQKILQTRRTLGDKISNIDIIDATKQQLDDQIAVGVRSGERGLVRDLVRVKNALVEDADRSIPEYKQARNMFAGKAQLENASELGEQFLKMKAKDVDDLVRSMGESEKKMFKLGAKNAVLNRMDDIQTNADLVKRLFGKRGDIKKLKAVFDDRESLKNFSDTLERESQFILTRRAAEANSTTVRQATDADSIRQAFENVVDAAASPTGAFAAIKRITGGLQKKRGSEEFIRALSEAGDLLLDRGADPKKIANLLRKADTQNLNRILKGAIKKKPKARGIIPTAAGILEQQEQQ